MAKSRNRSRDARKKAKKKRMNRERLLRRELEVRAETSKLMDLAAQFPMSQEK